jgi:Nucleotidyl transferase AbiEii toxin, Type IV TA system
MTRGGLTAKIVRLHRALVTAELPHAFGGALALAFCTAEPRATKDIDVNIFVGIDRLDEVVAALPRGIAVTDENRGQLQRDGQSRLWWADTPVDVFVSNHPFHDRAAANRRAVPFAGVDELPVLACADLAVFKAFFARPKDVVDVAAMARVNAVDLESLERTVSGLLGRADERAVFFERVAEAARAT